jgi:hypothetical protein
MNPICFLFGHKSRELHPGILLCERCYENEYGTQWTDAERYGALDPIRLLFRAVSRWLFPRCQHCGKRTWRRRRCFRDEFCSDKCFDEWMPF